MTTTKAEERYFSVQDLIKKRDEEMQDEVRKSALSMQDIVDFLKNPQYAKYMRPFLLSRISNINRQILASPLTEAQSAQLHGKREAYEELVNHFDNIIRQYADAHGIQIESEEVKPAVGEVNA